jgi:hypothetical protein
MISFEFFKLLVVQLAYVWGSCIPGLQGERYFPLVFLGVTQLCFGTEVINILTIILGPFCFRIGRYRVITEPPQPTSPTDTTEHEHEPS